MQTRREKTERILRVWKELSNHSSQYTFAEEENSSIQKGDNKKNSHYQRINLGFLLPTPPS
jgi:hypothetical protein